jgi:hypothetical protein
LKILGNVYIAKAKITDYLLRKRNEDDKSIFLAKGGFTVEFADTLEHELRIIAEEYEAELFETTDYGLKYRIHSVLNGINGSQLKIISIWMQETPTGVWKFITLIPDKEGK